MPNSTNIDRLSLVIMSALQLQPRASWTALSKILGVSPTTLTRRWHALTEEGLAWLTCLPTLPVNLESSETRDWFFSAPHGTTAYIEVVCRPGEQEEVIAQLVDDPRCWTIACTTGPRDLGLAVTLSSPSMLNDFMQRTLGSISGVNSMRASLLRGYLQSPTGWRIGALTQSQREDLLALQPRTSDRQVVHHPLDGPNELELAVIRELAENARMSASEVARRIGYSVSSVNDAIANIQNNNLVELRLDFDQASFGWNILATLTLRAPQSRIHEIGTHLRRFSLEVREAVSLVGGTNLQVHVWTKQMETIDAVEEMLESQFPDVYVEDRWVSTRFAKRAGVILDETGKRSGFTSLVDARMVQKSRS